MPMYSVDVVSTVTHRIYVAAASSNEASQKARDLVGDGEDEDLALVQQDWRVTETQVSLIDNPTE